jgi:sirohydrochlorin cobaltochelatase
MRQATVLFAHGARDPRWAEPFLALRNRVAHALQPQLVELAYLELMEPRLPAVLDRLAQQADHIRVVPVFLGTGSHVRRDLPELVEAARQRWPSVTIILEPPLGERPEVVDALVTAATNPSSGL